MNENISNTLQCQLVHSECLMNAIKINKIPLSFYLFKPTKSLSLANYHLLFPYTCKAESRDTVFVSWIKDMKLQRDLILAQQINRESVRQKVMQKVLILKRVFIKVFRGTEIQV